MTKLYISKGNSKLGDTASVSVLPGDGCPSCAGCRKSCYARKLMRLRPNVRKQWASNSKMRREDRDQYWGRLWSYFNYERPSYFRWHVSGDVGCQQDCDEIQLIAKNFPETKFLVFTKRHGFVWDSVPANLKVIFSMWSGFGDALTPGRRRAWMLDKKNPDPRIPKTAKLCLGNCEVCRACWKPGKVDVVFHKH